MYNLDEMTCSDQIEALRGHMGRILSLIDRLAPNQISDLLFQLEGLETNLNFDVYGNSEDEFSSATVEYQYF